MKENGVYMMKKRELGNSGLFVSELGLGTMSLPNEKEEATRIVDAALHAGINFFDTADLYDGGDNEIRVGQALKNKRQDIILATKVGNKLNKDGKSWTWDPSKAHISQAIKNSLTRLGTDYIDLYQLHGGTMEDDVDETIDALESLKKEGLIRHYGISSIRPTVIERFLKESSAVSVMMQYNLLDRRPEEWFTMIEQLGASIITRGTIAKGFLTSEGITRAQSATGFANYDTEELIQTVKALSHESKDLHAAAIASNLQQKIVATALIGARTETQLLESVAAYEKECSIEELVRLKNQSAAHQYGEHRLSRY